MTSSNTTGDDLLNQVLGSLARYVILPSPEAATAVTLWIAATHAAPAWNTAARLVIRAPEKRCGKSRLLDVIEAICHNPVMTINASPSAVYRLIGASPGDPPTVLIDEADTIFGQNAGPNEDLRGLLNAGHQRGRPALRYDASARQVERIDTYAMAALAGIGRMPDTIEDRAVIIKMRRRARHEHVHPYRLRRDAAPLNQLRTNLNEWVCKHHDALAIAMPDMPLEDRAADTWEALIAIADQAAGQWPTTARHAAVMLTTEAAETSEETLATQLLADCRRVIDGRTSIRTDDLLAGLRADPEAPWASHGQNGLSARSLAGLLKEFGITSTNIRTPGSQHKGYRSGDGFTDAWDRYLPPPPATQSDKPADVRNIRPIRPTSKTPTSDSDPAVPPSVPGTAPSVPPTKTRHAT